jgi:HEPN domain-containing protein
VTREPDFKRVEKRAAIVFWRRAVQCEAAMKDALARGHWEAAGINAVHCAISANDAVLAAVPAIKVTSKDHRDAVRLLSSRLKGEDTQAAAKRLDIIISKKGRVEYEQKRLSEKEARSLVLDAERFLDWAGGQIPEEFK